MRQGQQNRRNRGRGRNRSNNPMSRNYESNGPDVKIKGTAAHIAEKYMTLARDSLSSGNTVTAENYYQHAEHYNRIIHAAQAKQEEQAAAQPDKAARGNDRRPKQNQDNGDAQARSEDASIPGSGSQPTLNGNGATAPRDDEKPKRKPRPRKPKAAESDSADGGDTKDDNRGNIIAS